MRIAAYQLSLLGDAPKPGRAWTRSFCQWTFGAIHLPLRPVELRQLRMLHADTWTPELQEQYEREMAEWVEFGKGSITLSERRPSDEDGQ